MLAPRNRRPLPPPRFDAETLAEYARRGYGLTPLEHEGLRVRWLTAPDWVRAGRLPDKGADGFVPLAGFVHPATQAAVDVRYSRASFDFDPADFLEVADPRPASESTEYWLEGTLVAERAGSTPAGLFSSAAHRRGPHVLVVNAEWPAATSSELLAAITAFDAGLVIDAPPHAPVEIYRTAAPPSLPVAFEHAVRFAVREGGAFVTLRAESGEAAPAELTVSVIAPGPSAEQTLGAQSVSFHERSGNAEQASVRVLTLDSVGHASAPAAVCTLDLADGREATLAVVPLSASVAVLLEALYAGQRQSARGWMSARFASRRVLASCRLRRSR